MNEAYGIVLFDGDCNLCNKSVQFIIKHDNESYYRFASLQSHFGQTLLPKYNLPTNINSVVVIENDIAYTQSDAPIQVCKHLKGIWKMFYTFRFVPSFIRNYVYRIIANQRYRFGNKAASCLLPTSDLKKRFLS